MDFRDQIFEVAQDQTWRVEKALLLIAEMTQQERNWLASIWRSIEILNRENKKISLLAAN